MKQGNNSLPRRSAQVKTPMLQSSSEEDQNSDASSSHSCELDLAVLGEAAW